MFDLNGKWYDAIALRHSRRNFLQKPLNEGHMRSLSAFACELNEYAKGIRVAFVPRSSSNIFKGLIGGYGAVTNAPAYAAFIGNTTHKNVETKIGYYGECFILEAVYLGLGTCWVAGSFNVESVGSEIRLNENEKVYCVTPVGYVDEKYNTKEKLISFLSGSHKRKSLDEICRENTSVNQPKWVKSGLEAARLAPSAVNKQPWKFYIWEDSVTVGVEKSSLLSRYSPRLDCGIAMLHFELGALHEGVRGSWEYLESPDVARFVKR